jgi:hypothetical protein
VWEPTQGIEEPRRRPCELRAGGAGGGLPGARANSGCRGLHHRPYELRACGAGGDLPDAGANLEQRGRTAGLASSEPAELREASLAREPTQGAEGLHHRPCEVRVGGARGDLPAREPTQLMPTLNIAHTISLNSGARQPERGGHVVAVHAYAEGESYISSGRP